MAQALEAHWASPITGLVLTRYGYQRPCRQIEIVEAGHPVPDENGERAAARMLDMVRGLTADDLVICLMSGGGSALLSLPAPGLTLADKQAVNRALLACGATINEMNCVRKHLSAIKGGRLAAACAPAKVVTLAISDVPGDDLAVIASGPTVADPTTFADARRIVERYNLKLPTAVHDHLKAAVDETPKADDACFAGNESRLIATPQQALEAAAAHARSLGIAAYILSDRMQGEARDVGRVHAAIAQQIALRGQPFEAPCVLISGGETTVTLTGNGRGGRNTEFLLALADSLQGQDGIYALAADTDGIDGSEDNAGAFLYPDTFHRAAAQRLSLKEFLLNNDSYGFFSALGDLLHTGPSFTNVNDFRAILITG
jgi:hydroxypyruvate reductase